MGASPRRACLGARASLKKKTSREPTKRKEKKKGKNGKEGIVKRDEKRKRALRMKGNKRVNDVKDGRMDAQDGSIEREGAKALGGGETVYA